MKLAVQLFGHMRTFEDCAPALKEKLLDKYDCDVFIHTWDTLNHSEPTPTSSVKDKILSLYSPKAIKIERQDFYSDMGLYNPNLIKDHFTEKLSQVSLSGVKYMIYSICEVNKLRLEYQQSTINNQQSTINNQQSTINNQQSI